MTRSRPILTLLLAAMLAIIPAGANAVTDCSHPLTGGQFGYYDDVSGRWVTFTFSLKAGCSPTLAIDDYRAHGATYRITSHFDGWAATPAVPYRPGQLVIEIGTAPGRNVVIVTANGNLQASFGLAQGR